MRLILVLFLMSFPNFSDAAYSEFGFGIGKLSKATEYTLGESAGGSGISGNFSVYFNITSPKNWLHAELGIQNRYTSGGNAAMVTSSLATRIEFYRFLVGAGYAPLTFVNTSGTSPLSVKMNTGVSTYFIEGGAIWRIIPEFEILAVYSMEYGTTPGGTSPNPATSIGINFRFPFEFIDPTRPKGIEFDGFRYPFGIMK